MRIGIFGDSFADSNRKPTLSWTHYLADVLRAESISTFSRSGTSHWWSYEFFLKNYKDFDTIIFCHTLPVRWPSLPDEYLGYHWDVGQAKAALTTPEYIQKINRVFLDIFPEPLLDAISEHIFRKVDELCREANISLVHLTVGQPNYNVKKYTSYPVLVDVSAISFMERTMYKSKDINFWEQLVKLNIPDIRACHLLPNNNMSLAKLIAERIISPNEMYTNLIDLPIWNKYDPTTDDWWYT
jgi:hypothetical protein